MCIATCQKKIVLPASIDSSQRAALRSEMRLKNNLGHKLERSSKDERNRHEAYLLVLVLLTTSGGVTSIV